MTARPLALTRNIVLESVAPGVERLKGRVASHRQRKRLHLEVSHARPTRVVNELAVVAHAPVKPRRLLGELKRDGFLAGVPFSLGETPPYSRRCCARAEPGSRSRSPSPRGDQ
jgi:hypothetical protein